MNSTTVMTARCQGCLKRALRHRILPAIRQESFGSFFYAWPASSWREPAELGKDPAAPALRQFHSMELAALIPEMASGPFCR